MQADLMVHIVQDLDNLHDGLYIGESVTGQVYSLISGPPKESISRLEIFLDLNQHYMVQMHHRVF